MIKPTSFITIDAGLGGTGWAVFSGKDLMPLDSGTFSAHNGRGWTQRADDLMRQLNQHQVHNEIFFTHKLVEAFIEVPEMWVMSTKSYAASATWNLFKLAIFAGRIQEAFHRQKIKVVLVLAKDWKGQTKKHMTLNRIRRRIPAYLLTRKMQDHEIDAIGIGHAVILKGRDYFVNRPIMQ